MISDFALFLFTTLAGAAAGAYVARAIVPLKEGRKSPWAFALVSLVLLGVSGIALLSHLGHPELVFNAFNNLGAGIAQEGVTTMLFGVLVLIDCIMCFTKKDSPRVLVVLTAIAGIAMTVTMGMAYASFLGEPAWSGAATIPFFVLGDLAMGAGLYLAFNSEALGNGTFKGYFLAVQVLAAIAVIAVTAQVAGAGFGIIGLVAGLVIGPVAAAAVAFVGAKSSSTSMAYLACACAIVGMAVARYGFYAASLF